MSCLGKADFDILVRRQIAVLWSCIFVLVFAIVSEADGVMPVVVIPVHLP